MVPKKDIYFTRSPLSRTASWFVILSGILLFMVYFRSILQPFFIAVIIWFVIKGLRDWAGSFKIGNSPLPQWLRGAIAFVLILLIVWTIAEILIFNVDLIIKKSPEYRGKIATFLTELEGTVLFTRIAEQVEGDLLMSQLQKYFSKLPASISHITGDLIFILVYVIFLLLEESRFLKKVSLLFEEKEGLEDSLRLIEQINQSVNSYLFIKTGISLLTGILGYLLLLFLGVDFPFLWGFLLFLFNYVPYLGSFVATILPALFAMFQFGSFIPFLWVFIGIEAIQLLMGSYLEPRIAGRSLNLSPLLIIISLAFWGAIWGVLGMMLAVPITSILIIFLVQFPSTRKLAIMVSENGDITRLIKNDKNL